MSSFMALNLLIGLGFIAAVAYFVMKNYQKIQELLSSKLDSSLQRESEHKSIHPMNKIFLGYKHSSVDEWLNYIKEQDLEEREQAFKTLSDFIQAPIEELGSATGEIIKAIKTFDQEQSFDLIKNFMVASVEKAAKSKVVSVHYGTAAKALVCLDHEKALSFFKKELQAMKARSDKKNLQAALITALAEGDFNTNLEDLYIFIIKDIDFDLSIKELVFASVAAVNEEQQVSFWQRSLDYFIQRECKEFDDIEKKLLEITISFSTKIVFKGNLAIWKSLLIGLHKQHCQGFFEQELGAIVVDVSNDLSSEQLSLILEDVDAKEKLKSFMGQRFQLSKVEYLLLRRDDFSSEFDENAEKIVHIEKFSKTKAVIKELLAFYKEIEQKHLDFNDNNSNKKKAGVIVMPGTDNKAKQYLISRAAANANRTYVLIDAEKIIASLAELTKLKTQINNRKPCLVFITNLLKILEIEPEGNMKNNLNNFYKTIIDLSSSPSLKFFADLNLDGESFLASADLLLALERAFKKNHSFIKDLNIPKLEEKKEILDTYYLCELTDKRLKSKSVFDQTIESSANQSILIFVDRIKEILEQKLLTQGFID